MSGLSRRQAALLATLLDADGATVGYAELGDAIGSAGTNDSSAVRQYVNRVRAIGIDCVEIVPRRGCRMVGLPPDWALDDVLLLLDRMRRDDWRMPVLTWGRVA